MLVSRYAAPIGRAHEQQQLGGGRTQAMLPSCLSRLPVAGVQLLAVVFGSQQHRRHRRQLVIRQGLLASEPTKVPWHKKVTPGSEFWTDLPSRAELDEAVKCKDDKYAVVDFFAGWCASCKSAYPALSKIATSDRLRKSMNFYKANIEAENVSSFIKEHGVKGIPYILVFSPKAGLVASFPASFKKMEAVRHNLEIIASNSLTQKYEVDKDTGHVMLV